MIGSELMFSIAPIDVFDGGEIWVWDGVTPGGATFLNHGGHLWDTAFPVMDTFGTASENVNALEAVAVTPESASPLGLLAFGIGGVGLTLKRKGLVKFIDDVSNLLRCDVRLVRFGIDEDDKNTTIIFQLIDNTIPATFALLNVAVFEANFEDSVAISWDAIAKKNPSI